MLVLTLTFRFRRNASEFWESTYANENIIQWLDIILVCAVPSPLKGKRENEWWACVSIDKDNPVHARLKGRR